MNEPSDGASVATSAALVVFGATGDLASRKLYPALAAARGAQPAAAPVRGRRRRPHRDERRGLRGARTASSPARGVAFRYIAGSFDEPETFVRLREALEVCDVKFDTAGNRLYYLATVPTAFAKVANQLAAVGLAEEPPGTFRRLVIEKPFGHDLASARGARRPAARGVPGAPDLPDRPLPGQGDGAEHPGAAVRERDLRAAVEPALRRPRGDHRGGVRSGSSTGGRSTSRPGALRDIVQNHVLQVLALTAMEPPASFAADAVRDEKVKLLRSIRPLQPWDLPQLVVRGQYVAGVVDGEPVPGYRDEEGVAPNSTTETYLALRLEIDNWRWAGVPFFVRTGKRLPQPGDRGGDPLQAGAVPPACRRARWTRSSRTRRVLRIQPDEGIEVSFGRRSPARRSGCGPSISTSRTRRRSPRSHPRRTSGSSSTRWSGDATLFIRSDEVARVVADRAADRRRVPARRAAALLLRGGHLGTTRGRPAPRTRGERPLESSMTFAGEIREVASVPEAFADLVAERRPSSIALSGGSTAEQSYRALATRGMDWSGTDVFLGDERFVPVTDPDSNEGMIRAGALRDGSTARAALDGRGRRHRRRRRGRATTRSSVRAIRSTSSTSDSVPTVTPRRCSPARRR